MATMTRQHFTLMAEALRSTRPHDYDSPDGPDDIGACNQWDDCVTSLANALGTTNPRFDRERFCAAAGQEVDACASF